jgi:drug/metabolite transporter (DMT)-like permease
LSLAVFLAVILAALLHAVWNVLVKGGVDKEIAMAAVVFGHVPPALCVLPFVPVPAAESLPFIAAGVVLHTGYQFFLLFAYQAGDLTQVYPLARGSAPVIVATVSVLLLGVHLTRPEILAVAVIAAGIMSMSLVRRGDGQRNPRAAALALATGCQLFARERLGRRGHAGLLQLVLRRRVIPRGLAFQRRLLIDDDHVRRDTGAQHAAEHELRQQA